MKRVARLSVFFGLSVVLFVNAVFGFNLGDPMGGSFQDVYAISNGDENMGRTDDQYIYQCVDYVKRYYQFRNVLPNLNLDYRIYVARNYYVKYDDPGFSFIKESKSLCSLPLSKNPNSCKTLNLKELIKS